MKTALDRAEDMSREYGVLDQKKMAGMFDLLLDELEKRQERRSQERSRGSVDRRSEDRNRSGRREERDSEERNRSGRREERESSERKGKGERKGHHSKRH